MVELLETLGFRLWDEAMEGGGALERPPVMDGLSEFREHLGGELTLTLLRGVRGARDRRGTHARGAGLAAQAGRRTVRVDAPGAPHLTYCTNIHPGELWSDVRANLERYVLPVRARVAAGRRFGVGLRISGEAARGLREPDALAELQGFLQAHDLYVFTINGFPYGPFHGTPVKEAVYLPDWTEDARLACSRGTWSSARLSDGSTPYRRCSHLPQVTRRPLNQRRK